MKWDKKEFKDFVTLQRGFDLPLDNIVEGSVPVFGSNSIIGYHNVEKVKGPGVVTGRSGTIGVIQYTDDNYWPHNTTLWVRDFKGNYPRFVFYKLKTINLENFKGGASVPTLNRNNLDNLIITVPPKEIQKRIASTLLNYDELIENNRKRIALLEESARELYKEWFVRLRFPGHEKMKIKNGVPEGWGKKSIYDLTVYIGRGITPQYDDDAIGTVINQKCIREGKITLSLRRKQKKEIPKEKQILVGDILVNSTGEGTLGRVAQVRQALENHTVDSHVTIVRPKENMGKWFLGSAILYLEPLLSVLGRGATNQTELSRASIGEQKIFYPSDKFVAKFDTLIEPVLMQMENLSNQNIKLREARDILLPKLMNGEIEV